MRAVRIISQGGVEALEVGKVERPEAVGDQVRVRVHAAALNRADLLQRRGLYPAPPGVPADIPGLEFAGEIEGAGSEAGMWRAGQRVFGITGGGAQAEYVVVPETALAEIPPNLDYVEAAAVPEVFITAHDALIRQAGFEMGERVLIHAVGSGVGTAAIQLARAAGASVIFGTARTEDKLQRARGFGLDEPILVDDKPEAFSTTIRALTGGAGVHVILDLVGAAYLAANLDALTTRGRLMLVGTLGGASAALDFGTVMRKRLSVTGTVLRSRPAIEKAEAVRRFAAHVVPLLARGTISPVVDSVFDLDDICAAYRRLESNETFGKIIIAVTSGK
jgi:putative PIG3 family NAD(P)H quinone oxidoreductase